MKHILILLCALLGLGSCQSSNTTEIDNLWFYADYYVLDIDPDYRYVLIGSSSDKYLWIMSREENLPDGVLQELLDKLRKRGYDTDRLVFNK